MDAITRPFKIINGLHLYPNAKEKVIFRNLARGGLTFSRSTWDMDVKDSVGKDRIRFVKNTTSWISPGLNLFRDFAYCSSFFEILMTSKRSALWSATPSLFRWLNRLVWVGERLSQNRRVTLAASMIENIYNHGVLNNDLKKALERKALNITGTKEGQICKEQS